MILLSNSIPKTASTLIANYQEDFLKCLIKKNGQAHLRSCYNGRFIGRANNSVYWTLLVTNYLKGDLVVKCHWRLDRRLDAFCKMGPVRMTMSYRDPRDIILSMIDHGRRARATEDKTQPFYDCVDIEELIPRTLLLLNQFRLWQTKEYVHCIRYEDLMTNPESTLRQMINFLGWDIQRSVISKTVMDREKNRNSSLNFNTGKTERWRTEMSKKEKLACRIAFESQLAALGYTLE